MVVIIASIILVPLLLTLVWALFRAGGIFTLIGVILIIALAVLAFYVIKAIVAWVKD